MNFRISYLICTWWIFVGWKLVALINLPKLNDGKCLIEAGQGATRAFFFCEPTNTIHCNGTFVGEFWSGEGLELGNRRDESLVKHLKWVCQASLLVNSLGAHDAFLHYIYIYGYDCDSCNWNQYKPNWQRLEMLAIVPSSGECKTSTRISLLVSHSISCAGRGQEGVEKEMDNIYRQSPKQMRNCRIFLSPLQLWLKCLPQNTGWKILNMSTLCPQHHGWY